MSEQQNENNTAGGQSELSGLVSHLSTPEEIERFALEGNHAILYRGVQMYRHGKYTWEQAMQVVAFSQAETIALLNKELIRLTMLVPVTNVVGKPTSGAITRNRA